MPQSHTMSLGNTVRNRLSTMIPKRSQKWLATQLGMTQAELSKRLNCNKIFQDDEVVRMAEILQLSLTQLLILAGEARCEAKAKEARRKMKDANNIKEKKISESLGQYYRIAQKSFRGLLDSSSTIDKSQEKHKHSYLSLEDFPNIAEGPWTIIIGDRRERPVKGLGDLIGLSAGSCDYIFLHKLPLNPDTTLVRSDKTILVATEASLTEMLSTNLLVIGSPAVSLGARRILSKVGATFMFNIGNETYETENNLYERIGYPVPREELEEFLLDKEVKEQIDDLLATFRKNGFIDPIDFKGLRGRAISQDQDYGMVSLSANPWSKEHVVCICAGVHGGGTAGAVQLLSSPEEFTDHPWGGIFRVSMSDQVPWEKRFENLAPRWETHKYTPDKYISDIEELIKRFNANSNTSNYNTEIKELAISNNMLQSVSKFVQNVLIKKRKIE